MQKNKFTKKTIGILGGMGPEATIRIQEMILNYTMANLDQDHIQTLVYNNPKIPDRTGSILGYGPSALPYIIEGAKSLQNSGADFIIMPCITAYFYYNEIIKHISIPVIHILEETLNYYNYSPFLSSKKKIVLFATSGTIKSFFFQEYFKQNGVSLIIPDDPLQEKVMNAIYGIKGIKAGYKKQPRMILLNVIKKMIREFKPEIIIAGCTELSLVFKSHELNIPILDPMQILAKSSIVKAGYTVKI